MLGGFQQTVVSGDFHNNIKAFPTKRRIQNTFSENSLLSAVNYFASSSILDV